MLLWDTHTYTPSSIHVYLSPYLRRNVVILLYLSSTTSGSTNPVGGMYIMHIMCSVSYTSYRPAIWYSLPPEYTMGLGMISSI